MGEHTRDMRLSHFPTKNVFHESQIQEEVFTINLMPNSSSTTDASPLQSWKKPLICLSYKHSFGKNSHEKMNFCFVNHPTIRDDTWNNFNVQKIQRRGEFRPCVSLLPCCLSFDLRHDQFLEGFKEEDIKSSLVIQNQKSTSIHFLCIHLPFRDTENFSCQVLKCIILHHIDLYSCYLVQHLAKFMLQGANI